MSLVSIFGFCNEPAKRLVVMEIMEMSLGEALHVRQIQMDDDIKLVLMAQMWGALDYLHRTGVAHCDIKLDNFLLADVADQENGREITLVLT
jgi:serine/threonine protein kinase